MTTGLFLPTIQLASGCDVGSERIEVENNLHELIKKMKSKGDPLSNFNPADEILTATERPNGITKHPITYTVKLASGESAVNRGGERPSYLVALEF